MEKRTLGNSDLEITPIGFGAWAIGGGDWVFAWGAQDDADSVAAIEHAVASGINWIDTAAVYGRVARMFLRNAVWFGTKPARFRII
jgi:aryl-alcohol dehydrogenase-like predicted oxidoreductase